MKTNQNEQSLRSDVGDLGDEGWNCFPPNPFYTTPKKLNLNRKIDQIYKKKNESFETHFRAVDLIPILIKHKTRREWMVKS